MGINITKFPYSMDILFWLSDRVQSNRYMLNCAEKFLESAFPNQNILFSSVFGHFRTTQENILDVPDSSVVLIAPQSGFALVKAGSHVHLLEKGTTMLLSGPMTIKIAFSAEPFEFYTCRLGIGVLHDLIQALLVSLGPGEFRVLRNSEICCPPEILEGNLRVIESQFFADSTLLHLLAIRIPAISPRNSFAPKTLQRFNHYGDLANSIWANPDSSWSLSETAKQVGYSTFYLSRTFREESLVGFKEFIVECKVRNCSYLILNENLTIEEALSQSGLHPKQSLSRLLRNSIGFSHKCLNQFRDFSTRI